MYNECSNFYIDYEILSIKKRIEEERLKVREVLKSKGLYFSEDLIQKTNLFIDNYDTDKNFSHEKLHKDFEEINSLIRKVTFLDREKMF